MATDMTDTRSTLASGREGDAVAQGQLDAVRDALLIIADGSSDPEVIASEMIAQAEHDPLAAVTLVATEGALRGQVEQMVELGSAAMASTLGRAFATSG